MSRPMGKARRALGHLRWLWAKLMWRKRVVAGCGFHSAKREVEEAIWASVTGWAKRGGGKLGWLIKEKEKGFLL